MKNKVFSLMIFVVVIAFMSLYMISSLPQASGNSTERWEYVMFSARPVRNNEEKWIISEEVIMEANRLGNEGWELVSVNTAFEAGIVYYFKRRLQ